MASNSSKEISLCLSIPYITSTRDGKLIDEDDVIKDMNDDVCIILLPSVLYRSSQLLNMERIANEARKRGIIVGLHINTKHFDKEPGMAGWHGNKKDT